MPVDPTVRGQRTDADETRAHRNSLSSEDAGHERNEADERANTAATEKKIPAATRAAKAATTTCKAAATITTISEETSAAVLGSVRADDFIMRGQLASAGEARARGEWRCGPAPELAQHRLSEHTNTAEAQAKKMPAEAKSAKAAAAACKAATIIKISEEASAAVLGLINADDSIVWSQLTSACEVRARGHGLCGPAAELATQQHHDLSRQEQDNTANKMPAAAKSAKAAAAVKCKAVKTTMVGDETSAMGLGSVKAGGPIVRGQHGPAERANMAGAEANKIPATKLAKAAAATNETSAAGLGSSADDFIMRGQLASAGEVRGAEKALRPGSELAQHNLSSTQTQPRWRRTRCRPSRPRQRPACKAATIIKISEETSAVGLGLVKAGEPMVRGHLTRAGEVCARGHGLCGPA